MKEGGEAGECQGWPRREREGGLKDRSVGRRPINTNSRKQEGGGQEGRGRGEDHKERSAGGIRGR